MDEDAEHRAVAMHLVLEALLSTHQDKRSALADLEARVIELQLRALQSPDAAAMPAGVRTWLEFYRARLADEP